MKRTFHLMLFGVALVAIALGVAPVQAACSESSPSRPIPSCGYVVIQEGDSTLDIAYQYGLDISELNKWNGYGVLEVGQKFWLREPQPEEPPVVVVNPPLVEPTEPQPEEPPADVDGDVPQEQPGETDGQQQGESPADDGTAFVPSAPLSYATLQLPEQFPSGYLVRFGVMEFTSSDQLMLKEMPGIVGRVLSALRNGTMNIPGGASLLNGMLGGREGMTIYPGRNGGGLDWQELQAAVLAGQVTHVVQCVVSELSYKTRREVFEDYGIETCMTDYSLVVTFSVYDLSRRRTVLAGNCVADWHEKKPFNPDLFVNDVFAPMLKQACAEIYSQIEENFAPEDDSEPKILPAEE